MSDKPPRDRKVSHYVVNVQAYLNVTQMLGNMPFKYAAGPLQVLTEGTRAIFEEPTDQVPAGDQGSITEVGTLKHDWRYSCDMDEWRCEICGEEDRDAEEHPPTEGCTGPPEAVDNDPEESK